MHKLRVEEVWGDLNLWLVSSLHWNVAVKPLIPATVSDVGRKLVQPR